MGFLDKKNRQNTFFGDIKKFNTTHEQLRIESGEIFCHKHVLINFTLLFYQFLAISSQNWRCVLQKHVKINVII